MFTLTGAEMVGGHFVHQTQTCFWWTIDSWL